MSAIDNLTNSGKFNVGDLTAITMSSGVAITLNGIEKIEDLNLLFYMTYGGTYNYANLEAGSCANGALGDVKIYPKMSGYTIVNNIDGTHFQNLAGGSVVVTPYCTGIMYAYTR